MRSQVKRACALVDGTAVLGLAIAFAGDVDSLATSTTETPVATDSSSPASAPSATSSPGPAAPRPVLPNNGRPNGGAGGGSGGGNG